MLNRFTLFVIATIATVVYVAPSLSDQPASNAQGKSESAYLGSNSGANSAQTMLTSTGEKVLSRQSDGHFYADGRLGPASVRFLVDTGASVVALTAADARAAGISWHSADIEPIGTGASGEVRGVHTQIDRLEVGGITAQNVRAVVIPEGLQVSLLGQSFLSHIDNVSIKGDEMVLNARD